MGSLRRQFSELTKHHLNIMQKSVWKAHSLLANIIQSNLYQTIRLCGNMGQFNTTNHLSQSRIEKFRLCRKVHISDRHLCNKDTTQAVANWNIARRVRQQFSFKLQAMTGFLCNKANWINLEIGRSLLELGWLLASLVQFLLTVWSKDLCPM